MTTSSAPFALIISAAAIGYLLTFTSASVYARRGSVIGRAAGFAVGVIVLPALALIAFAATIAIGLRCDDGCNQHLVPQAGMSSWMHSPNGWQWQGQWIVALGALVFALAAIVLLTIRKERPANLAAALTTVCVILWAAVIPAS